MMDNDRPDAGSAGGPSSHNAMQQRSLWRGSIHANCTDNTLAIFYLPIRLAPLVSGRRKS